MDTHCTGHYIIINSRNPSINGHHWDQQIEVSFVEGSFNIIIKSDKKSVEVFFIHGCPYKGHVRLLVLLHVSYQYIIGL